MIDRDTAGQTFLPRDRDEALDVLKGLFYTRIAYLNDDRRAFTYDQGVRISRESEIEYYRIIIDIIERS